MPFDIPNLANAPYAPQATLTTVDIDALVAGIASDGVETGCAVTAQGTPNMTVAVASGTIRVAGVTVAVAAGNVTITAAHATLPRIDLIVASNSGTKSVVTGTAAAYTPGTSTPVPPNIPASSVLLAHVYVPPTATAITSAMITDKRVTITPGIPGPQGPPGTTDGSLVFVAAKDGVSDVSNALSTALNNANTLGVTLVVPPGRYRLNSTISEKSYPIRLKMEPGAVFETYHTSGHTLKCAGSISGTVTNLTAAVTRGDVVIQVPTSGYAAGDYVMLSCPEEIWSYAQSSSDPDDFYHFKGQILQIRHLGENISGTVSNTSTKLTFMEPVHTSMGISGYTAPSLANSPVDTLAIRKITMADRPYIKARFKNMVRGTTTSGFVRMTYCLNPYLEMDGENAEAPGSEIINCYGGELRNKHKNYNYDSTAGRYAYGDSLIGATCHLQWHTESRDGYSCGSTNGQQYAFGEPYDIDVYPVCHGSSGAGFTTHQEGKKIRVWRPVMIGTRGTAITLRGVDCEIHGGEIADCVNGVHIYANASDIKIDGLTIRRSFVPAFSTTSTYTGYGIIAEGTLTALNNLVIKNCTFENIAKSAVRISAGAALPARNVEVAFCTFRNYNLLNTANVNQINGVSVGEAILDSAIHHNRMLDDQGVVTSGAFVRVNTTQTAGEIDVAYNKVQSGITVCSNAGSATLTGNY